MGGAHKYIRGIGKTTKQSKVFSQHLYKLARMVDREADCEKDLSRRKLGSLLGSEAGQMIKEQ